jgi:hypothetical protein
MYSRCIYTHKVSNKQTKTHYVSPVVPRARALDFLQLQCSFCHTYVQLWLSSTDVGGENAIEALDDELGEQRVGPRERRSRELGGVVDVEALVHDAVGCRLLDRLQQALEIVAVARRQRLGDERDVPDHLERRVRTADAGVPAFEVVRILRRQDVATRRTCDVAVGIGGGVGVPEVLDREQRGHVGVVDQHRRTARVDLERVDALTARRDDSVARDALVDARRHALAPRRAHLVAETLAQHLGRLPQRDGHHHVRRHQVAVLGGVVRRSERRPHETVPLAHLGAVSAVGQLGVDVLRTRRVLLLALDCGEYEIDRRAPDVVEHLDAPRGAVEAVRQPQHVREIVELPVVHGDVYRASAAHVPVGEHLLADVIKVEVQPKRRAVRIGEHKQRLAPNETFDEHGERGAAREQRYVVVDLRARVALPHERYVARDHVRRAVEQRKRRVLQCVRIRALEQRRQLVELAIAQQLRDASALVGHLGRHNNAATVLRSHVHQRRLESPIHAVPVLPKDIIRLVSKSMLQRRRLWDIEQVERRRLRRASRCAAIAPASTATTTK